MIATNQLRWVKREVTEAERQFGTVVLGGGSVTQIHHALQQKWEELYISDKGKLCRNFIWRDVPVEEETK